MYCAFYKVNRNSSFDGFPVADFLFNFVAEKNIILPYFKLLVRAAWRALLASARKLRVQMGSY